MIKKYGNEINGMFCTYICDTINDLSQAEGEMGYTVFVIHTRDIYMMDGNDSWVCITSAAESVPCNCVEESTIWTDIPIIE